MTADAQPLAAEFEDAEVARCYRFRAPYPDALHHRLVTLAAGDERLLDLGCGPGKLARALAGRFKEVDAVDPSGAMLAEGQRLDAGRHPHIRWIEDRAEEASFSGPYDLVVAGASIHWMRHELVMPKLAGALKSGAPLALVSGDGPAEADWLDASRAVIPRWIERNGRRWGDETHRALMTAHAPWLDEEGSETFQTEVRQSVDDLIAGEHSRATWARARMGPIAAELFDNELREALEPAALNGEVSYVARVTLTWGRPLASPMPRSDRIR
jgi:SAM-dependent methyltransferase